MGMEVELGCHNGEGYDFVYPCTNVHEVVYVVL
jgi:hypothetical protein